MQLGPVLTTTTIATTTTTRAYTPPGDVPGIKILTDNKIVVSKNMDPKDAEDNFYK